MTFQPYQKTPLDISFTYKNTQLEVVNDFTLLGLVIDKHVNWKAHIKSIRSKISSFAYALYETKKTTDIQTALALYHAYASAWLSYGIILWGHSTDVVILFIQQNKLIRILANIGNMETCKPHFQKYKILTLPCTYILEICKFTRQNPDLFKQRQDLPTKHALRYKNKLLLPASRLKIYSNSTYVMAIKVYNKLPSVLKSEESYTKFIKKVKCLLVSKCYYSVNEYLNDKFE
jgi:hypothetical protein